MRFKTAFQTLLLCAAGLIFISAGCTCKDTPINNPAAAGMPLALKVKGNRILNSKNQPVTLRGVNVASLEWTSDGEGQILQTTRVAIDDWKSNIIRLPLSQDRWFGKAPEQNDPGTAYRALVKEIVDLCSAKGCYIILDLHWNNVNEWGQNIGQHSMPDRNSVVFWKDFAAVYANHPAVLFDLYNEPHDVSWDVWLNGGKIIDRPNRPGMVAKEYDAVGMQELLDTVRSTGAKNVIVAGGLDWAYDMSGFLEGKQLKDPTGNGIIYANHAYDNKGEKVSTWIANMEKAAAKIPIIISEFGGSGGLERRRGWWGQSPSTVTGDDWLLGVIKAIHDHNWSFTAWDLHIAAGPTLISDWDYTPTPDFGVYVKDLLVHNKAPEYTPPDLSRFAKGPGISLPQSARVGGPELHGDWQMNPQPGDRMSQSILAFGPDREGKLTGNWIFSRDFTELQEVRFQDKTVTFTQTVRFEKENELFKGYFTGAIEGDTLTGTLAHGPSQMKIEGKRIPAMPPAVGLWEMTWTTQDTLNRAMLLVRVTDDALTAQWQKREGQHVISDVKADGNRLTFMTTPDGSAQAAYTFDGTAKTDILVGVLKGQADEIPVQAQRLGTELIGTWSLDVTTLGGVVKQRLKVNPDMSGLYGTAPIEHIALDGSNVSFKVTPATGRRRTELNFEGKLDGLKLSGELKSPRSMQVITGTKAGQ